MPVCPVSWNCGLVCVTAAVGVTGVGRGVVGVVGAGVTAAGVVAGAAAGVLVVAAVVAGGKSYFCSWRRYASAVGTEPHETSRVLVLARTSWTLEGAGGFSS